MKSVLFSLCLFISLCFCFTTEEVEIFELQKDLVKKYGKKIDFYKLLKLAKGAQSTDKEITKQFRALSRKYHPDKNVKYTKLYQRLNNAKKILLNSDARKSYDYYLKHGFPKYNFARGGYYFERYSLKGAQVMFVVFLFLNVIHYFFMKIQVKSKRANIDTFVKQMKDQYDDTDGMGIKELQFDTSETKDGSQVDRMKIKFGQVYTVEESGAEILMDSTQLVPDTKFSDVFVCKILQKLLPKKTHADEQPQQVSKKSKKSKKSPAKTSKLQ
ncbi:hypothetical protein ACO0QE_000896 [Hanseniaspora vineae]